MKTPQPLESRRKQAFGAVRILFGLIWLVNTWLQLNPAYSTHFLGTFDADWVSGQPAWIASYGHWMAQQVQQLGAQHVAYATIALDAILAISLITGIGPKGGCRALEFPGLRVETLPDTVREVKNMPGQNRPRHIY